jgi:hypothetical protein
MSVTQRERTIKILQDNPEGVSKSELRRQLDGNAGAFRRLVQNMQDKGEIVITEENRPDCGLTKVVRLGQIEQAA